MNVDELGDLPLTDLDKLDIVAFLNTLTDGFNPDETSADIPEPASWTIMAAGFGMVGAAMLLRRRRRNAGRATGE